MSNAEIGAYPYRKLKMCQIMSDPTPRDRAVMEAMTRIEGILDQKDLFEAAQAELMARDPEFLLRRHREGKTMPRRAASLFYRQPCAGAKAFIRQYTKNPIDGNGAHNRWNARCSLRG